ncbi:MAG: XTP/dITP diphosphatase [Fusobacteriota bacterium]
MVNKKIFLATKNKGKIKEMKKMLENVPNIEVLSFLDGISTPEIIEDGNSFEENSCKKASEIAKYLQMWSIADDSGIVVEALDGAPGIYSARYAGENATDVENLEKLRKQMKKEENKKAKYVAVISISDPDGNTHSFKGELKGEIIDKKLGENGFGYDPIFYLPEYKKTSAEISSELKNEISHRGKALKKLKQNINNIIYVKK